MRSSRSRETALKDDLGVSGRQAVLHASPHPRKKQTGRCLPLVRERAADVHLLVTAGDGCRASAEVNFVNTFFKNKAVLRFTLFDALKRRIPGSAVRDGESPADPVPVHRDEPNTFDAMRGLLLDCGIREERIRKRVLNQRRATMNDLRLEAASCRYDAVLLRKAGRSLYDEFFSLCVTREALNHGLGAPIWICQHTEPGCRSVLLCVDETGASVRMAEYVGSMLQSELDHGVTVFHVDTGERSDVPEVMERARQGLIEGGLSDDRIRTLVMPSMRVIEGIREEALAGGYAVAAFGHEPGAAKAWLPGSRCLAILETLDKCTLWVGR